MLYLNLNIRNPWWWRRFENIKNWHGEPTKNHKCWEIQVIKNDNLLRFEFEYTIRQDHAGLNLELGLFGYEVHLAWYDTRHWHTEKERWVNYDDPSELETLYGEAWTGKK